MEEITKEEYEEVLKSVAINPNDYGRILNIIQGFYAKLSFEVGSSNYGNEFAKKSDRIVHYLTAKGFYKD